jgi:hypothetical protein
MEVPQNFCKRKEKAFNVRQNSMAPVARNGQAMKIPALHVRCRLHAAKTEMIGTSGSFAFAASSDHVTGAVLICTQKGSAPHDPLGYAALGRIEGVVRAGGVAADRT